METPSNLRRQILDSARLLLLEDGFKNLSMRKIARQIDCSQGTIYLYFKNKEAIFFALFEEGTERLYTACKAVITQSLAPLKQLEGLCHVYINFAFSNPNYYEIMYMHLPISNKRFPKEQYQRVKRVLQLTADTLSACAEAKLLNISDPFLDATVLWGILHGMVSLILNQMIDRKIEQKSLVELAVKRAINAFCYPTA